MKLANAYIALMKNEGQSLMKMAEFKNINFVLKFFSIYFILLHRALCMQIFGARLRQSETRDLRNEESLRLHNAHVKGREPKTMVKLSNDKFDSCQ